MRVLFVVAGALIDPGARRVLLAKRPAGKDMAGLWEYPGGKPHADEPPEQALSREFFEELGLQIDPADWRPLGFASHPYPAFHLVMPLFFARRWQGTPQSREGQAFGWFSAQDLASLPMPPADIPLTDTLTSCLETMV